MAQLRGEVTYLLTKWLRKGSAIRRQKTKVYGSYYHLCWFSVTLGELLICYELSLMSSLLAENYASR